MKIIIGGAGAVGTHLSKLLSRDKQDCTLVDEDEERLAGLDGDYDIMTLQGSPTSIKALVDAGAKDADLFVGVTPDESCNMNACILAHALGAKKTVARIDNYEYLAPELAPFFKKIGIDSLIYPEVLAGVDINNSLQLSWARQRWDVYGGVENITNFRQKDVICGSVKDNGIVNPRQPSFDASCVWGPLMGIKANAGFRFTLWKK